MPASVHTGRQAPFEVTSSFTQGANGSEALTVFLIAPPDRTCPADAVAPAGADSVLSGEAADQVLIVNALSGVLDVPGAWTACAYLTAGGSVTASASQPLTVTGHVVPRVHSLAKQKTTKKKTTKHHKKATTKLHHKP